MDAGVLRNGAQRNAEDLPLHPSRKPNGRKSAVLSFLWNADRLHRDAGAAQANRVEEGRKVGACLRFPSALRGQRGAAPWWRGGMAVSSIFRFPGVARGLVPLAGGDGGNAPRHPAIGMEARKGGDAGGGSVHDSPAASGGSPAPLPHPKDARHKKELPHLSMQQLAESEVSHFGHGQEKKCLLKMYTSSKTPKPNCGISNPNCDSSRPDCDTSCPNCDSSTANL